jgi:nitric oxide reductase subunit B-like protein/beta-lactamase family protein
VEASGRRQFVISRGWIQGVVPVVLCGFSILGLLAYRTYVAHPPVPDRVVDDRGRLVDTGRDVSAGHQVFVHNALMEYGSAFGHGAYLGPDYAADYLRLAPDIVLARDGGTRSDAAARRTIEELVLDRPIVSATALASARRYARSRRGSVSFAVVEDRARVRGYRRTAGYPSASVIKAMVMVAVLRRAGHRRLTSTRRSLLYPMITRSDNAAAIALWNELGASPLRHVAAAAGMRRFAIGAHLFDARIDASDQARFFLVIDRLVPVEHRTYARRLLASIVSWQRWGIANAAARHGFRVRFKGGWRTAITHQVALLQRRGRRLAIAVCTASGPSMAYDEETIEGIAERLLRHARAEPGRRLGSAINAPRR